MEPVKYTLFIFLWDFLSLFFRLVDTLCPVFFTVPPFEEPKRKPKYIESEPRLLRSLGLYGHSFLFFIFIYLFISEERNRFSGPFPVGSFCLLNIWHWQDEVDLWCLSWHRGGDGYGRIRLTPRWEWSEIVQWDWKDDPTMSLTHPWTLKVEIVHHCSEEGIKVTSDGPLGLKGPCGLSILHGEGWYHHSILGTTFQSWKRGLVAVTPVYGVDTTVTFRVPSLLFRKEKESSSFCSRLRCLLWVRIHSRI